MRTRNGKLYRVEATVWCDSEEDARYATEELSEAFYASDVGQWRDGPPVLIEVSEERAPAAVLDFFEKEAADNA